MLYATLAFNSRLLVNSHPSALAVIFILLGLLIPHEGQLASLDLQWLQWILMESIHWISLSFTVKNTYQIVHGNFLNNEVV